MSKLLYFKEIILNQQEEVLSELRISPKITRSEPDQSFLDNDLIKVIMGVRRCGKSVFALQIAQTKPPFIYINFDDERLIDVETKDLNDIFEATLSIQPKLKTLILDEIQNIKAWELFVNRLKRKNIQIIITGSNGKLLSHDLATHLTGRQLSFEMFPFNFSEYLKLKNEKDFTVELLTETEKLRLRKNFDQFYQLSGFPEVIKGVAAGPYLRELFNKIITRDIVQRYRIRNSKMILELALYLTNNIATKFSYQKAAKIFSFKSVVTVKNYIQYLQDSYLLFELLAYSNKLKERVTLPRKYYSIDLGLIQALRTKVTPDLGANLENFVFIELKKRQFDIYYLPGKNFEIDFVVRKEQKITELIQVSYDISNPVTRDREINALKLASIETKCKKLTLITYDHDEVITIDSLVIHAVSVSRWLLRQ